MNNKTANQLFILLNMTRNFRCKNFFLNIKLITYVKLLCGLLIIVGCCLLVWKAKILSSTKPPDNISIHYYMTSTLVRPEVDICKETPEFVLLVDSNVDHHQKRFHIRHSLINADIATVFMVGAYKAGLPAYYQDRIQTENEYFEDILQGSFEDSSQNSTFKTLMGLRWAITNCKEAPFIIKIHENLTIGIKETLTLLNSLHTEDKNKLLLGHVIDRKKRIKEDGYDKPFYPRHVSGEYYVMTPQVAARLTKEAPLHQYLPLEDVFVTGILTKALGIPVKQLPMTEPK